MGIKGVGTAVTRAVAVRLPVVVFACTLQQLDANNAKHTVNIMAHSQFFTVSLSLRYCGNMHTL